jgi:DNA modification methylase
MEFRTGDVKRGAEDDRPQPREAYKTSLGRSILAQAEDVLQSPKYQESLRGKVDLIFTSPPFPLNRKKKYGNEQGEAYVKWLADFAPLAARPKICDKPMFYKRCSENNRGNKIGIDERSLCLFKNKSGL